MEFARSDRGYGLLRELMDGFGMDCMIDRTQRMTESDERALEWLDMFTADWCHWEAHCVVCNAALSP